MVIAGLSLGAAMVCFAIWLVQLLMVIVLPVFAIVWGIGYGIYTSVRDRPRRKTNSA